MESSVQYFTELYIYIKLTTSSKFTTYSSLIWRVHYFNFMNYMRIQVEVKIAKHRPFLDINITLVPKIYHLKLGHTSDRQMLQNFLSFYKWYWNTLASNLSHKKSIWLVYYLPLHKPIKWFFFSLYCQYISFICVYRKVWPWPILVKKSRYTRYFLFCLFRKFVTCNWLFHDISTTVDIS